MQSRKPFHNYDRLVNLNRHHLIESYVKQYGEENREFIKDKYNQIRICFYENPRKLREYIETRAIDLGRRFTRNIIKETGLDVTKVYVDKEGNLTSDVEEIKNFIMAFFPNKGIINYNDHDEGIFSFLFKYDEETEFNLYKKAIVLQQLGHIDKLSDIKGFIKTDKYKLLKEIISLVLKLAERYRRILFSELEEVNNYLLELEKEERDIVYKYFDLFVCECKTFLSKEDKELLRIEPNIDYKELKSVDFLCDRESIYGSTAFKTEMPFEPGLLEYFLPEYSNMLGGSTKIEEKEIIISKRLEYLRRIGVDITEIGLSQTELFTKDWYQIPGIGDKIPKTIMIEKLKEARERHQLQCLKKLAPLYVVNNYKFNENALDSKEIRRILFLNTGEYVCRCVTDNGNVQDLSVFISPLDGNYKVLDITLDHEIRHGLEYSAEIIRLPYSVGGINEGTPLEMLKAGLNFSFYINGDRAGHSNLRINEVMTQKLSLESTRDRYDRGIYILTSPEDAVLSYTSNYDFYIPNFDFIFTPEMQDLLLKSRLSSKDYFPIYSVIPQEVLTQIDNVIMDNSPEAKEELARIKASLTEIPSIKM